MQGVWFAACGTMFTFLMTALGSALVFFFKKHISEEMQRACLGFAGGVMAAAAVFSLLIPAIEQTEQMGGMSALVAAGGFAAGAGLMLAVDAYVAGRQRGESETARRQMLMMTAVTLHNIPEGMAVGLAFAQAVQGGAAGLAAAITLALGIGLQNLPEGAAISLPLRQGGMSRMRSFWWGVLSGAVEPLFGVLVVLAASAMQAVLPALMAFAAGAMMLVVVTELIPSAAFNRRGVLCVMIGYVLMMAMDVALG